MTIQTQAIPQKPKQIIYATRILWCLLFVWALPMIGYSIFSFFLPFFIPAEQLASPPPVLYGYTLKQLILIGSILIFVISSLLIYANACLIKKVKAGNVGSRLALFLFFTPKIVLSLACINYYISHGRVFSFIIPFFTLIEMLALTLLYLNPAAAWFKKFKRNKQEIRDLITIQMPPQPKQLKLAIRVLLATYLLGLLYYVCTRQEVVNIIMQHHEGSNLPANFAKLMNTIIIFSYLFIAWLMYKVAAGRNWARKTLLTLSIIGYLITVQQFVLPTQLTDQIASKYYNPLTLKGIAWYLLQIMNFIAICLLFSKSSNAWYKKQKELEKQLSC